MSPHLTDDDSSELEVDLRRSRPAPRQSYLAELITRAEAATDSGRPSRRTAPPRFRFGLAAGFATVFVVVFGAFGGLGYANSSVHAISVSAPRLFSHVVHGSPSTPARDESSRYGHKAGDDDTVDLPRYVLVCLTTRKHDIPLVFRAKVANWLISKGKAHLPPCRRAS